MSLVAWQIDSQATMTWASSYALQKRDFRNYYAFARLLGAKLVLTGMFKHYTDYGAVFDDVL
jgi:hypothetical protein